MKIAAAVRHGGRVAGFPRARTFGRMVPTLLVTFALFSCSNIVGERGTTNSGATTRGETMTEETMVGETMMEETMAEETTEGGATKGATMPTKSGDTMARGTTAKGGETSGGTKGGTTAKGSAAATGETITDVRAILSEQDKQFLVGRPVRLAGASVRSIVNRDGFLIGPSDTRQLFVVLEGEQARGAANVEEGQTISVDGVVRQLPDKEEARQRFGLSETEAALLQSQEIYLSADRVEVTER